MSQENVEAIRQMNDVFNERPDDASAWLRHYHPDAEFVTPPEWPEERVYRGHDGIARLARAWTRSLEDYHWDTKDLIDAGDDTVVGLFLHRGRLSGGVKWIEREVGAVWHLRDGKVARAESFFSWREALDAAGLSE
jgi:ketosteroid isomerase-like protein